MPTCSQAKIITNLESDIHKRLFELTNLNINNNHSNTNNINNNNNNNTNSSGVSSSNGDESPNNFYLENQTNTNQRHQQDQTSSIQSKFYINNSNNRLNSLKYNQDYANNSRRNQLFYYPSSNLLDIRKKTIYELVKPLQQQQQPNVSKSRRQSLNTESSDMQSTCCEMPPLVSHEKKVNFNSNIDRKESVPVNFLYNSSLRVNNSKYSIGKTNLTKSKLNRIERSDGEEDEVGSSDMNSEKSNLSLPEIVDDKSKLKNNEKTSKNDFTQYVLLHDRSKRNSIDSTDTAMEGAKKFNSYSNHNLSSYFSNFPKLALEVEAIEQYSNSIANMQQATINNQNDINLLNSDIDMGYLYSDSLINNQKKFSVNQAKRLLALASIRPSKTFHKTMTDEEVLILKKYYEEIKPKPSNGNNNNSQNGMTQYEIEKSKYETFPPIVYDTAKVDFSSLNKLKNFITLHKKEIEEGIYCIDYDMTAEPKGFVLRDVKNNENVIKFPNELNDSFLALAAANSPDKESQLMNEANLFRIVNWNDTIVAGSSNLNDIHQLSSTKNKSSKSKLSKISSNADLNTNNILLSSSSSTSSSSNLNRSTSPSSTLSFEYIKNLSNLVSSILEPKLLKQLTYTGVDVSVLPGGKNFEMPSFEELGIDLNGILSNHSNNNNINGDQNYNITSTPKIKLSTIKKMKEKVNSSKVMWFSGPPERKPLSVIFEYPSSGINSKIDHETILNQTNAYLKEIGGHVESLELIPRSVQFGSVYVEDLWVLTLNHMNTKFYTITNGIKINDEKILVKSYDDFIFSEYERFIRNEKFKKIIKNHEKVLANKNNNKSSKLSSLSNQQVQQQPQQQQS